MQGNHPDYRALLPEALAGEAVGAAPAGADEKADGEEGKKTRTLSKEIKIEQVRALLDFCGVGAHRGGARVVLVYPAEALNAASANALLKTLEEPPAGVVFLLVSARVDRLPQLADPYARRPSGTGVQVTINGEPGVIRSWVRTAQ